MTIRRELIDELLKDYEKPQDHSVGGWTAQRTDQDGDRTREQETELDTHLGYPEYARKGDAVGNMRNGHGRKTLKGEQGHVDIEVPRDRQGSFEPQFGEKGSDALGRLR